MLTEAQIKEVMTQFQKEMMVKQKEIMAKQQEEMKEQGKVNKVKGEKFLAENKKKEGVKTTESGLQYIVIKEGEGDTPQAQDREAPHSRQVRPLEGPCNGNRYREEGEVS